MPASEALKALERAEHLLTLLDRQHSCEALHRNARAVRQEVQAARVQLGWERAEPEPAYRHLQRDAHTHRILQMLSGGPLADRHMYQAADATRTNQRKRRKELVAAGFVQNTGVRVQTDSGHMCWTWEITDAGRKELRRLETRQLQIQVEHEVGLTPTSAGV